MKLCFIATQAGEYGGSEVLWYMTAREALLKGIKVLVSVHESYLEHAQLQELINLGAELHLRQNADLKKVRNKIVFKLRCFLPSLNLFAEVNKYKPDIIIVSQRGTYDVASQLMLYKFLMTGSSNFILISQFHVENKADLHQIIKQRSQKLFASARRVYFVSERNKIASEASIERRIINAFVINNPIKLNAEELEWPGEETFSVACVARINYSIKRQNLLVNVFAQEKWRARNIKLNLFGDGPDAIDLKALVENKQLENAVSVLGQVEDIRKVWEHNHLLILPSVAEGLPLSLIEANLFGRAAITTNVGDNEKLVLPDKTGFLISDFSEQALDNALEEAWGKRNMWKFFGSNARKHAVQNLDINIHHTLLSHLIDFANE